MIKRTVLVLGMILALCLPSMAEDLSLTDMIGKLPGLKQGVAYSLIDNKVNYLTTVELANWKGFAVEIGYAGDAENTNHKIVGVISADLVNLKKLGVTVPILDLIDFRVGAYGGMGQANVGDAVDMRGNNEWDAGVSLTAISVKF